MKRKILKYAFSVLIICIFNSTCPIDGMPAAMENVTDQPDIKIDEVLENRTQNDSSTTASAPIQFSLNETPTTTTTTTSTTMKTTPAADLEASGSEQQEQTIPPSSLPAENVAAPSISDPAVYGGAGGYLTPEAFQQYINQFGTYPYGPAPYPAPIYQGFAPPPPIYPSPYVVETGYDGYLVPTTATASPMSMKPSDTTISANPALKNPLMLLGNLISTIMMSTFFRILATIASALGMIFFSGHIISLICTYTPICNASNRAVEYLRRGNTSNMGRMIAENVTPERVRRAAEFVRNAINKYQELQQLMGGDKTKEF